MRLFAATLAFASSCLMLGLMVNGHDQPQSSHYIIIRRQFDFAHLCILLTGLAFFVCLIASFIPEPLRKHYGQRVTSWVSRRGEQGADDDE